MSENLNSYADSVLEEKIKKNAGMEEQISDIEDDISELDGRVTALEEGGGGDSSCVLDLVYDSTTNQINYSYAEIIAAQAAGKIVRWVADEYGEVYYLGMYWQYDEPEHVDDKYNIQLGVPLADGSLAFFYSADADTNMYLQGV